MERANNAAVVATGTASLGDHSQSELRTRDLRAATDPSQLRMFSSLAVGDVMGTREVELGSERQAQLIERDLVTEPLSWYTADSPWGGPVAAPSTAVQLMTANVGALRDKTGGAVGLYGAIEVAHVNGPIILDRTYSVTSKVVAVGESPKTEYLWFDATAADDDRRRVATMRMLLRFMKASSELYK
jgi:hypothetical protein